MATGEIVSIHFVRSDGGPAQKVEAIEIVDNFGFKEDYRSGPDKKRQITLVEDEALQEAARLLGRPVREGASRRQIVVRGLDLNSLIGSQVRLGSVTLAVEKYCAPCHRMEEELGPGGRDVLRWKAGVCCSVKSGGRVKVGDAVQPMG
jgi:MOSC domain-containing protein YiiM